MDLGFAGAVPRRGRMAGHRMHASVGGSVKPPAVVENVPAVGERR
jgi:hypothetical protein